MMAASLATHRDEHGNCSARKFRQVSLLLPQALFSCLLSRVSTRKFTCMSRAKMGSSRTAYRLRATKTGCARCLSARLTRVKLLSFVKWLEFGDQEVCCLQ